MFPLSLGAYWKNYPSDLTLAKEVISNICLGFLFTLIKWHTKSMINHW